MKIVIFGLVISSSWGNGHATLWRGLCKALGRRKHRIVFFERDVPYYAAHRDGTEFEGVELRLYSAWEQVRLPAQQELADADVAIVTSYCPDALDACDLVLFSPTGLSVFYDMDTGITLKRLRDGDPVSYIPPDGLAGFDLVLSYTGGRALAEIRSRLGARRVEALYGSVDPEVHFPAPPGERYRADMSYLGTYAEVRQQALIDLFVEPARRLPWRRFLLAGSQYPEAFPWTDNIHFIRHLPPADHPAFYCSSRLALNVTRQAMAAMGYCPSGRLFEASACGAPLLSDDWDGLDRFFEPNSEILIARTTGHAMDALHRGEEDLKRIGRAARERTLSCHTAAHRALELEAVLEAARSTEPAQTRGAGGEAT